MKSLARRELNRLEQEKKTRPPTELPPLLDWIPQVSPQLQSPRHLKPYVDMLERAELEPIRLVASMPPQHGKSTLVFHWIAHVLMRRAINIIYITYNTDFAETQMRLARRIAERAGVRFTRNSRALLKWETELGGKLYATGLNGGITGHDGGGIIIIDDPVKGWADAQSLRLRETADEWMKAEVLTRKHPSTSILLNATRWHEDDQSGRLIARGWNSINLPAINDNGEALWPEGRPLEFLLEQKSDKGVGEFIFSALFQGRPRPRGGSVFNNVHYYNEVPSHYQTAIGVDLAYTAKSSADYSVSLVLAKSEDYYYVLDVIRKQVAAPDFGLCIQSHSAQYPRSSVRWYYAGTERASIDFLERAGIKVEGIPATGDKFVRAQPVARAWNDGKILLPREATWLAPLLDEVLSFTGVNDKHDDIIDALAAAFDRLSQSMGVPQIEVVRPRTTAGMRGRW